MDACLFHGGGASGFEPAAATAPPRARRRRAEADPHARMAAAAAPPFPSPMVPAARTATYLLWRRLLPMAAAPRWLRTGSRARLLLPVRARVVRSLFASALLDPRARTVVVAGAPPFPSPMVATAATAATCLSWRRRRRSSTTMAHPDNSAARP